MPTPRALTLQDVFNQLDAQSTEAAFDPNVVINALASADETLKFTSETLTATTTTNYPVNVIQDVAPVAYLRLDDPASSTTVFDSQPAAAASYPKNTGSTVHGGVTFAQTGAMTGSLAASFDGTSGYISVPNATPLQLTGDLSIEFWINTTSLATRQTVISKSYLFEFELTIETTGGANLFFGDGSGVTYNSVGVLPSGSITTGVWYHVVIVRSKVNLQVNGYLNGVLKDSQSYTTGPSAGTNPVIIGANQGPGQYVVGKLDEVALYQYPLSTTEINNHYTWGTASTVNATAYNTGTYGRILIPIPGPYTISAYGSSGVTWGSFVWG